MCAAHERGFDMKIDPRGSRAGRAQDPGPSIDAFEDEHAVRQLLADANAMLRSRVASVPSDFIAQVFAGAVPEDLVHYQACEIAEIAEGTWRFLGERQPLRSSKSLTTICRFWSIPSWRN